MRLRIATRRLAAVLLLVLAGDCAAAPPRRVVSFNICADQLVLALADPAQIAALSPYAVDPALSVVADKAKGYRTVPLQAESVIPLDPDLVLVSPRLRLTTQPMLRSLGFNIVAVDLVNDFAAARAQILGVAALLGHPERGQALAAELDVARARLAALPRHHASALMVGNGGYTVGPDSLAAALLRDAGFDPPPGAPSGFGGIVPLERLIALRPDYLVLSAKVEEPDGQGALYLAHPALRALYPPARRIILPERYTICGGQALVAAIDYLAGVVKRVARVK